FMRSFTQGTRFGLDRSAMRKLGCLPAPLGTKGCAGSSTTGARRPGTGSMKGPPPLSPTPPAKFDETSGGAPFCATADGIGAARFEHRRRRGHVLDVHAEMTDPEWTSIRRLQLDESVLADLDIDQLNLSFRIVLPECFGKSQRLGVIRNRLIEIGHIDPDVIQRNDPFVWAKTLVLGKGRM